MFRATAQVVLGDQALTRYPQGLSALVQGFLSDKLQVPISFALFLALALAARFSGVRVEKYRFWLFVLTGLMAGLAAVLLTGRIGSTHPISRWVGNSKSSPW